MNSISLQTGKGNDLNLIFKDWRLTDGEFMQASILTDLVLPLILAFMMFGMGLTLTVADFKRVTLYPKPVIIGTVNQILVLPIVGFALVKIFQLSPELGTGLMIVACCPGGITSNLITYLAKGDVALSVTLTAISSVITVLTIPIFVNLAMTQFSGEGLTVSLPIGRTILQMIVITLIPISIGMLVRFKYSAFAHKMEKVINELSGIFFLMLVLMLIVKEINTIVTQTLRVGPSVLALNIITMAIGYFSAKIFSLTEKQSICITIEVGLQNTTLALLITTSILKNAEMSLPAALYGLIMFGSAGLLIYLNRRRTIAT